MHKLKPNSLDTSSILRQINYLSSRYDIDIDILKASKFVTISQNYNFRTCKEFFPNLYLPLVTRVRQAGCVTAHLCQRYNRIRLFSENQYFSEVKDEMKFSDEAEDIKWKAQ